MRIGIRLPPCRPASEVAAVAQRAEEAGFDTVGIPDSPTIFRDTMVTLAVAALQTQRITLATSVTNVVTRQPLMVASAVRTVAELAPGRFRLGLGAGDSSAFLTGRKAARTAELRDAVETITDLLAGRTAMSGSMPVVLLDPPGAVPVFLAAEGPRNLALAAEIADGVISWCGGLERKVEALRSAAESHGRTRTLHHVATATCRVTADVEKEAQDLKPYIVRFAQRDDGRRMLAAAGFEVTVPEGNILLPDGTDLGHPRDFALAVQTASQWISDEVAVWYARNLCLFGSGEEIAQRILALADLGIDEVQVTSNDSFVLPTELIDDMGAEVIPRLRSPDLRRADKARSG